MSSHSSTAPASSTARPSRSPSPRPNPAPPSPSASFATASQQTLKLTVGQYAGKGAQLAETDTPDGASQAKPGKLGLAVANLDPDTRSQLQLPGTSVHGVVVAQVRPDSPADNAGLQQGDVILEVNRHPVTSADNFVSSVRGTSPSDQDLLLLVWSKGNASYRTLRTLPNQG